jgi:excinuclease ABC subunit A
LIEFNFAFTTDFFIYASSQDQEEAIEVRGARVHNLKNISFRLPVNQLTVVTAFPVPANRALAFDTVYAEGQRRYVESLSAYARQFSRANGQAGR